MVPLSNITNRLALAVSLNHFEHSPGAKPPVKSTDFREILRVHQQMLERLKVAIGNQMELAEAQRNAPEAFRPPAADEEPLAGQRADNAPSVENRDKMAKRLAEAEKIMDGYMKSLGVQAGGNQRADGVQPAPVQGNPAAVKRPAKEPMMTVVRPHGDYYERTPIRKFLQDQGVKVKDGEDPREALRNYWKTQEYDPINKPEHAAREERIAKLGERAMRRDFDLSPEGMVAAKRAGEFEGWQGENRFFPPEVQPGETAEGLF